MFTWIRELLEIRYEFKSRKAGLHKVCQSCETLKQQLEIANYEKRALLDRLLKEPEKETIKEKRVTTIPRTVHWNIRRQMLEQEDREKAKLMREAPKPQATDDLEKELNIASANRESEAS